MTLRYPGPLPPGALVRADPAADHAPAPAPGPRPRPGAAAGAEPPAPVWFRAADGLVPHPGDPGRIAAWEAAGAAARAAAVAANAAGTRLDPGPPPALAFTAGVNGGLAVAGAVAEASACGFGAILGPDRGGAGTILTLLPAAGAYLCLSHRAGRIAAGLRGGGLDLSLAAAPGWLLVLCGVSGGMVRLSVNGAAPVAAAAAAPLPAGPADLCIACRGPRPGLAGKLGGFLLTDVFLWPDRDPLAGGGAAPAAAGALWQERRAHGP